MRRGRFGCFCVLDVVIAVQQGSQCHARPMCQLCSLCQLLLGFIIIGLTAARDRTHRNQSICLTGFKNTLACSPAVLVSRASVGLPHTLARSPFACIGSFVQCHRYEYSRQLLLDPLGWASFGLVVSSNQHCGFVSIVICIVLLQRGDVTFVRIMRVVCGDALAFLMAGHVFRGPEGAPTGTFGGGRLLPLVRSPL